MILLGNSRPTKSSRNYDLMFFSTSGDATIDGHSAPSTLGGETGAMVDKFRQLKLKEYNDIVKLCKLNNVPLTEDLLKRG